LRYDRDGYSVEAAILKGRRLPEWYSEEPPAQITDFFYQKSFWDLSSTRRFEHGPIPWDKIVEYGYHTGLDNDMIDTFVAIIRAMDAGYLNWLKDEIDRQRKQKVKKT